MSEHRAALPTFLRELADDFEAHANGDLMEPEAPEVDAMLLREAAAYLEMLEELVAKIAAAVGNCA